MSHIQKVLADWQELRVLRVYGWSSHLSDTITSPKQLHGNLKNLQLSSGTIRGSELSCFATPFNKCNLSEVMLLRVEGITNENFCSFLSAAAHSLRKIEIFACSFPRSSPDEELALDAVMHRMTRLQKLKVEHDLVSCLTLVRKPKRISRTESTNTIARNLRSFIEVTPNSGESNMTLAQVAATFLNESVTGWAEVKIAFKLKLATSVEEWELMRRAATKAKEQGVLLDLKSGQS